MEPAPAVAGGAEERDGSVYVRERNVVSCSRESALSKVEGNPSASYYPLPARPRSPGSGSGSQAAELEPRTRRTVSDSRILLPKVN